MSDIHVFNHGAMATQFQVRIANEEKKLCGAGGAGGVCLDGPVGIALEPLSREQ